MLIVALQDVCEPKRYAVWNTVTDEFVGVNLNRDDCAALVAEYREAPIEYGYRRVDRCQSFMDIVRAMSFDEKN